jgi:UDPglucose 6-dehydrogenase
MNSKKRTNKKPTIGFIGQGWIGKHYADDFERRGFTVIRYSQEHPHTANKEKIKDCDIVFIAVPTPTTPKGFDDSIVRSVIKLVGKKKIAVIKSTVLPGTTESIQKQNPHIFVMHSPEFLSVATAKNDAEKPKRNIIGIPKNTPVYKKKAKEVMAILPKAPYKRICSAREAELIKYGRNVMGYARVVYVNLLYDLAKKLKLDWNTIQEAMSTDPDNGPTYMKPIHKTGRGAGGHCFIKDYAAFAAFYSKLVGDLEGKNVIHALEKKNIKLLRSTKKDLDILKGVYGHI